MSERDYYDLHIDLMDTGATFEEIGKVDAIHGRPFPCTSDEIDDEETGKRWKLYGLSIGQGYDRADLMAMLVEWGQNEDRCVTAAIEDNGKNGDGLWLTFRPTSREGTHKTHPEKWGDRRSHDTPAPFFEIRLTPSQAKILGMALVGVANIREAQEK